MHCLPIRAEIDLRAIAHNLREIRRNIGPAPEIMAVVKANAYGHGAAQVARTALAHGASCLAVARVSEGVQLREEGITAPILILGYSPDDCAPEIIRRNLTPTIYSIEAARALSQQAEHAGSHLQVHIKVDTGMGRLGIATAEHLGGTMSDAVAEIQSIAALSGLEIQGIFTHFAGADSSNKESAGRQLSLFNTLLDRLRQEGITIPIRHCANSASIIDLPDARFDMVRAGIMLYGLHPSDEVNKTRVILKPAMQIKATVAHIKSVPAGCPVSYGSTHVTSEPTRIATIPVGYADGYSRLLSSKGFMIAKGKKVPVVGRVCMDQTMIDALDISDLSVGDEVTVLGCEGDARFDADDIAAMTGTINYEVVSTIMDRVPRIFIS